MYCFRLAASACGLAALVFALPACGGIVEASESERSGELARDVARGSEAADSGRDPALVGGEAGAGRIVSDDELEAAQPGLLNCSCSEGPYDVFVDDQGVGVQLHYDLGPRKPPEAASSCGEVAVPSAIAADCTEASISACNDSRQCMQLRYENGVAIMNLWDFGKDTVRVVTEESVAIDYASREGITYGTVSFRGADGAPLYDVVFTTCALLDTEIGPCSE